MNNFALIGRAAKDVTVFNNSDGSAKVKMTVAVKNSYKSADGTIGTQFIPVEHFVSAKSMLANGIGVYALIHQGDQIAVEGDIRQNNWTDANGQPHYDIVLNARTVELLESKTVTAERLAEREKTAETDTDAQ